MKIALLGATGRTGGIFLKQALDSGHQVVAYARRPEAISPATGLTTVGGQLEDADTLARALSGCDAVVITLGPKITQASIPLMSIAVPAAIAACKRCGIKRIIVLSALGVGNTYENTRYPYRFGCRTFLKGNQKDHHTGESQLENSGLSWTTIHPGPLFNGDRTANPTVIDASSRKKMSGTPRTRRADVASLILRILNDSNTFEKQLLISSTPQLGDQRILKNED